MKRAKILLRGLAALAVMLISVSCNTKSEKESFNLAGTWCLNGDLSGEYDWFRLTFLPDGRFCPLSVKYDTHRFRHYEWTGDSLILSNDNGMKAYYHILSYTDSTFVIADYPEYGDTLYFNKGYTITKKEWQEKDYLSAFDFPDDSLDFIVYNSAPFYIEEYKLFNLSEQQMIKARKIFEDYYYEGYLEPYYKENLRVSRGFPLDFYFRRYAGYIKNGHKKVYIALNNELDKESDNVKTYEDIKNSDINDTNDGGPYYGEVYIDLDENKVEWLYIHGEA